MSDSRKTRNRKRLIQKIEIRGIEISVCNYYFSYNFVCRVFFESKYCENCVHFNRADYNVTEINFAAFAKINKKYIRLRSEQYFVKLIKNTVKIIINAAYTKRRKFEKFKEFLNAREGELIRRDVKIIKN